MMKRGRGMPHENPWLLITRDEIAEIRRQLEILEENKSEKSRENTGAIAEILTTVRWRLRYLPGLAGSEPQPDRCAEARVRCYVIEKTDPRIWYNPGV
jgi:hypothetical protein